LKSPVGLLYMNSQFSSSKLTWTKSSSYDAISLSSPTYLPIMYWGGQWLITSGFFPLSHLVFMFWNSSDCKNSEYDL
jgi:hypothetical protein